MSQKADRSLNLNRLKYSKALLIITVIIASYYRTDFAMFDQYKFIAHAIGFVFIMTCILGRIYSTAFLGGFKANTVIDYGPFSVVRNPLYIFSFIGVMGLSFMSNNLMILAIAPIMFILIYYPVIVREERYLQKYFGEQYKTYCSRVNRVVPNFKGYIQKDNIMCSYKPFESAFKDSLIWIMSAIVFYSISVV